MNSLKTCFKQRVITTLSVLTLLTLLTLAKPAAAALSDGLVAYWTMDNADTTGGVMVDKTGNYNGTITGVATGAAGVVGEAYDFTGTSDYVDVDASFKLPRYALTVQQWFKLPASSSNEWSVSQEAGTSSNDQEAFRTSHMYGSTSKSGVELHTDPADGDLYSVFSQNALDDGAWHHLVFTYDAANSNLSLYVDGEFQGSATTDGNAVGNYQAQLRLGMRAAGTNVVYNGYLDEVAVWNRTLTPAEIQQLYNNGTGLSYSELFPPAGAPYLESPITFNPSEPSHAQVVTANTTYTHSDGLNANVSVKWEKNGAFQFWDNKTGVTNGSVVTSSFDCSAYNCDNGDNLTVTFNATDVNGTSYAVSGTVQVRDKGWILVQSFEKVSGAAVTNFSITTPTTASTTNGTVKVQYHVGNHTVTGTATGYLNTVTAQAEVKFNQTTQVNLTGFYTANVSLNVTDGLSGLPVVNYSAVVVSNAYSFSEVKNSSGGQVWFGLVDGSYNLTVDHVDYSLYSASFNVSGSSLLDVILYPDPSSVQVYVFDEGSVSLVNNRNVTLTVRSDLGESSYVFDSGSYFVGNLTPGNYSFKFLADGYASRSYVLTVGYRTTQVLNAYLVSSNSSVIFTVIDADTGQALEGVVLAWQRSVNGSFTTVESRLSDVTGRTRFAFDPLAAYKLIVSKEGYASKTVIFDPVIFTSYDVTLQRSVAQEDVSDFSLVSPPVISPTVFYDNRTHNFSFTLTSPTGVLTFYDVNVSYPGGSSYASGSNAGGGTLAFPVTVSGAVFGDVVTVVFSYNTTIAGRRVFSRNFEIVTSSSSSGSFERLRGNTFGLGDFELALIMTGTVLFVAGAAALVAGSVGAVASGLLTLGFFAYQGFVPLSAVLISVLAGFVLLIWRTSR